MAYTKQNYIDGEVLTASRLNAMDDQIAENEATSGQQAVAISDIDERVNQNTSDISEKEDVTNKTTSISSSSTNEQYPSAKAVYTELGKKQNEITDLSTIRSGANKGATAYQKPSSGIPKSDLSSEVLSAIAAGGSSGGGGSVSVDGIDKIITVNEEVGNQYTKIHVDSEVSPSYVFLEPEDIIDNLVTTTKGYALDARQGKALNDSISGLRQDLAQLQNGLDTEKRESGIRAIVLSNNQTARIETYDGVAIIMSSPTNSSTFIARTNSSGVSAFVGSLPSGISISKIENSVFTIKNTMGWGLIFHIFTRVVNYTIS